MKQMTAAERAKGRLKAVRGPRLPETVSILGAVARLVSEADKAQDAMQAEELDPADIHLGILFSVSTAWEHGSFDTVGVRWLGDPGKIGEFIAGLEQMEHSGLLLMGLVWGLLDREAGKGVIWARPLVTGQEEKLKLAQGLFHVPFRVN
jgi:hypothetical protein